MFIIAFRSMVGTLATLKTFSKFDWADLAVVLPEEEFEGYKSWYLYYKDQQGGGDPKVPVPIDVDFDIELVRTDRINVVYILNLLKNAQKADKTQEEKEADLDLILREVERSDNESLRAKKDIMVDFIRTRFYELPEDADLNAAFEEFSRQHEQAEMEEFATEHGIQYDTLREIMTDYVFSGNISDEAIRKHYSEYHFGLLKITKLTEETRTFAYETYKKYRAEGN